MKNEMETAILYEDGSWHYDSDGSANESYDYMLIGGETTLEALVAHVGVENTKAFLKEYLEESDGA